MDGVRRWTRLSEKNRSGTWRWRVGFEGLAGPQLRSAKGQSSRTRNGDADTGSCIDGNAERTAVSDHQSAAHHHYFDFAFAALARSAVVMLLMAMARMSGHRLRLMFV